MRRIFREYTVLLTAPKLTQGIYRDMLAPFGFGQVEATHEDQQALNLIKKLKPKLVMAAMSISVFTGPQLLTAARADAETRDIPFAIMGVKEDLKPGGLGEIVLKAGKATFVALPVTPEQFEQIILELLDPLIDQDKEKAYMYFDQGQELLKNGDHAGACELFTKSLDLSRKNLETWLAYATAATEAGRLKEAETAYFQALSLNQYSFVAYLGLAGMYERQKEYQLSVGILRQALSIAQRLKVSAKSQSRFNFFIGEMELRLKHLGEAELAFSRAMAQSPDDAQLLSDIGDAYSAKEYFAESEQYYEGALELDPNLAHVFNKLGMAYRRQGKFDKAMELYQKARLHHPEDEHLLFNIARVLVEQGMPAKAVIVLEEALKMAPEFREAKVLLTKIQSSLTSIELDKGKEEAPSNRIVIALD
ncbi:MAG: tetratricopeptide repeat protein [Deltaproteobacteria bacterium]|nr:tetratricopeptide repeat protein [Deltaproteobacteria bacterium]